MARVLLNIELMSLTHLLVVTLAAGCVDPSFDATAAVDSYSDVELTADVLPQREGAETIVASVTDVTVQDARGTVLMRTSSFDRHGSADEVLGIRIIRGASTSDLIAVTTTVGGFREATTFVSIYAIDHGSLKAVVVMPIEAVEDDAVRTGGIVLLPGFALGRAPGAERPDLYPL